MKTAALQSYLAEHPLLRDMEPGYIRALTECASEVGFAQGELIFRQGKAADRCYLIRQGNVAVQITSSEGDAITIQTLGPREVLGWSWLFPPYRWHYDARALEATEAVAIDGADLRHRFERNPKFGYDLMIRLSAIIHQRMQAARLQILDLYGAKSD